jgi:proteasome lid subunit RPN8/RPN11
VKEIPGIFKEHALSAYPNEACGVVIDDTYHPCSNASQHPRTAFKISPVQLAELEIKHGKIQALLHSHTYKPGTYPTPPPQWPSYADQQEWLRDNIPWGIIATDGVTTSPAVWLDDEEIPPLIGREFVFGVTDCYTLIRDYYRQEWKVMLNNYARRWGYWKDGTSLYEKHFKEEGFVEVLRSQARIGDAVLIQRPCIAEHAGIISGPNTLLHHLLNQVSKEEPLSRWSRYITKVVRYKGKDATNNNYARTTC